MTQDKAGARGELGHQVPSPELSPLGRKGRCNPSSPDAAKLRARCQLHCSTHLHMLETEGRCSVATDRTRNCEHDTNSHFVMLPSQNISPSASVCLNAQNVSGYCTGERNPHPQCPEGAAEWCAFPNIAFPSGYFCPAQSHRSLQLLGA